MLDSPQPQPSTKHPKTPLKSRKEKTRKCNCFSSMASNMENTKSLKVFRKVDKYGDSGQSPSGRGTTVCGGFLTIIFASIVIVLIVLNIVRLAEQRRALTTGDRIHMNREDRTFKLGGFIDVHGQSVHFPVLNLRVQNEIFFFEVDHPCVKKIRVSDNTHYNPSFTTMLQNPPTTRSVYSKVNLPFDSVDDPTGQLQGRYGAFVVTSNDLLLQQLPSLFSEDVQTIQLLQEKEDMEKAKFYPHTTSLYVRFQRSQIEQILDNQLDISIYNKGEYDYIPGTTTTKMTNLNTLASSPTVASITSMKAPFDVLALKSSLETDLSASSDGAFLNWQLRVQYTSNYNYTLNDFYCYNEVTGILDPKKFTPLTYASPPSANATSITLVDANAITSLGLPLPFELLIWDRLNVEKVVVTSIDQSTFYITRTGGIDFTVTTQDKDCFNKLQNPLLTRLTAPVNWTCPLQFYNDKTCDCNCGEVDIDCAVCPQSPTNGLYCSYSATQSSSSVAPSVAVGVACSGTNSVRLPADGVNRGYFGNPDEIYSPQCPDDIYYNGAAVTLANGTIVCNAKPSAQIMIIPGDGIRVYQVYTPLIFERRFAATLTLGTYNYIVNVTAHKTNFVDISGIPAPTPCGRKPNIPSSSLGYLRSPLKYGDNSFIFSPMNTSNAYLPPDGPYTIYMLGEQLTVTSASCPRTQDGAQVIVVSQPPSQALIDKLAANTLNAVVVYTEFVGASVLPVAATSNVSFVSAFCCRQSLHVSIGDSTGDSYVYEISKITNNDSVSCCDVDCSGKTLFLFLRTPLVSAAFVGTRVSAVIYPSWAAILPPAPAAGPFPQYCVSRYADYSAVQVIMLNSFVALPTSLNNENMFLPNDRYKSFPAQALDLEVAMFIIPQKSNFSEFSNLCSTVEPFTSVDPIWVVQQNRTFAVEGCSFSDPSVNSTILCQVANCPMRGLAPTQKFKFAHSIPVNEKWEEVESAIDKVNSPEYLIDVSSVYYFDYTAQDLSVSKTFSQNVPEGGDYDQYYNQMKFNGELDYIGRLQSDDPDVLLYPANGPILDFYVELEADKVATRQMLNKIGKKWGVEKAQGWSKSVVDEFPSLKLSWPSIIPLTLQPGHNYTFKAAITLQPVFNVGIMGGYTLERWINSTVTDFVVSKAEFANGNRANVRLLITFNSAANALENRTIFTIFDFISAVGASVALFQVGKYLLTVWQYATLEEEAGKPSPYSSMRKIQMKDLTPGSP